MIYQRFALAVTFGTRLVLAPPQLLGPRAARAEAQQTAPVSTIDVDSLRCGPRNRPHTSKAHN